jgi:hypothetical protein
MKIKLPTKNLHTLKKKTKNLHSKHAISYLWFNLTLKFQLFPLIIKCLEFNLNNLIVYDLVDLEECSDALYQNLNWV